MGLKEEIAKHKIDTRAVARIQKRVFVVGRFNQHDRLSDEPGIYLFTNRSGRSSTYDENFTATNRLSYENFVDALKPAIAESVEHRKRFPLVKQGIPGKDEESETSFVVDLFNYFFNRAVSHSDQPEFKSTDSSGDPELLEREGRERGKGILQQVRRDLTTFSKFQHRNPELVEEAAQLLADCAGDHSLPPYTYAGALPEGFPEKLIDYMYSDDQSSRFDASDLGQNGHWEALSDPTARKSFEDVTTAFRDAALDWQNLRFQDMYAGLPLHAQVRKRNRELLDSFRTARAAVNRLKQILRSKVLLSMILEWVIESMNDLPDVKTVDPTNKRKRNEAMSAAILGRFEKNGLAHPIKRPSKKERDRFDKELADGFGAVVRALVAKEDADFAQATEGLSAPLSKMIHELRGSAATVEALRMMLGSTNDRERMDAFVEANQTVLLDVLSPSLFRSPLVTAAELERDLRRDKVRAYIAAVLLSKDNQNAVMELAETYRERMEEEHVKGDQIVDSEDLSSEILMKYVQLTARPEVQVRITECMRALREAGVLQASSTAERRGFGDVTVIRDHEGKSLAGEQTPTKIEVVRAQAASYLSGKLQKTQSKATESDETPADADVDPGGDGSGASEDRRVRVLDEGLAKKTDSDQIQSIMKACSGGDAQEQKRAKRKAEEIADTIASDPEIIEEVVEIGKLHAQVMDLIYRRYSEAHENGWKRYAGQVEKMTLTNLMLLFKEDLGLGRVCSNLYQLLLDLVLYLDAENPDPASFLAERSLTSYFDNETLDPDGIDELRNILEMQSQVSLKNIVNFVSELRGVKYLMDKVGRDPDAEVVVVNADAAEFLNWLREDNLLGGARGRFSPENLSSEHGASEKSIIPGLVYMTDIAFEGVQGIDKKGWIENLAKVRFRQGRLRYSLPPICVSTGPLNPNTTKQDFATQGADYADATSQSLAPVMVLGPSPRLNPAGDGFATILPAGYLFAVHFLNRGSQGLTNPLVNTEDRGRFRVISGAGPLAEILDRIVWGDADGGEHYAFAGDFFMHIVLNLVAACHGASGSKFEAKSFYEELQNASAAADSIWRDQIGELEEMVFGGVARGFALEPAEWEGNNFPINAVWCSRTDASKDFRSRSTKMVDVGWFNRIREALKIQ